MVTSAEVATHPHEQRHRADVEDTFAVLSLQKSFYQQIANATLI